MNRLTSISVYDMTKWPEECQDHVQAREWCMAKNEPEIKTGLGRSHHLLILGDDGDDWTA